MKFSLFHKLDNWINRILSYPGITRNELAQKKMYWIASVAVTFMILCLTISYHLIFPQLRIIIYYGFFLSFIFLQGIVVPLFVRRISLLHQFIDQTLVAIATLICILKLGGIPYSGGLAFVGLALVFFSLNFNKKSFSIAIFIIYMITVIIAGILHPYLTVPPEMTPAVNISLFIINLLWISGFAMVFVMNFISQSIKIKHIEAEQLRELNEAKTKLYTNITHGFRTPLTIILGMVDLIRDKPKKWISDGLQKIETNSRILLHLVDQMLNLAKLEAHVVPITMIQGDIVPYIKYLIGLFSSVAESKKIKIKYFPEPEKVFMDYDPEKIMEIVTNLVSNALKYTNPGGVVEIQTRLSYEADQNFILTIKDNGPGIPADKLPLIFDRFFRIDKSNSGGTSGSGLGLALTKELIKLLDGEISVKSVYGEGTEFLVSLPVTNNATASEEIKPFKVNGISVRPEKVTPLAEGQTRIQKNKPLLLIVEDSVEVADYLNHILDADFNVQIALDGKAGLQKAFELIPDIVLTDVMMPELDGIELLDRLKNDVRTSHIPVVILTAKADILSRIEGLRKGADGYLSKPFNKEELFLHLKKLIELRKKLQERYTSAALQLNTGEKEYELEDKFMQRINSIIQENLANDRFNINGLCQILSMSRTQLYRKFKSLTNRGISEYLLSLRLLKARDMLKNSGLNVSETAYSTGFKNLSHFSKVFTKEFGMNPSHFK